MIGEKKNEQVLGCYCAGAARMLSQIS